MANIQENSKFNRLTVLGLSHIDSKYRKFYKTRCECGVEKVINSALMVNGNTKSCGCLAKESAKATRISEHHSEVTAIILGYKRHAKGRGHAFELSREFVARITAMSCHYCGSKPGNFMKTKNSIIGLAFNGIDRVDNTQGYNEANVVPCCKICNRAKGNLTVTQFLEWAKNIAAH